MGALLSKIGLPVETKLFEGHSGTQRSFVEAGRNFGQILRSLQKADPNLDLTKISAQVLSLLQSGMPIQTIVDHVAQTLASKVGNALSQATSDALDDVTKNKLFEAFASALAPPGGAPPGSRAEQATTLADKLQRLIARLGGDADANAGQQNRFAGPVLDADTAKEIPAMQQNAATEPSGAARAISFIESVLADAVAALNANATPSTPAIPLQTQPVAHAPAERREQGAILGRIIARAVTANANSPANLAQAVAPATAAGDAKAAGPSPGAARASLENLVAVIVQSVGNQQGGTSGNAAGNPNSFAWTQGRSALRESNSSSAQSTDRGSFAAQTNALLATAWAPVASANGALASPLGPPVPYTTIDASSVIEQVIKGMQIKTFGADRSEVRMRLSPEHLGDVCVTLSMNGGNISASITAQNADVRDTLLANQNALVKSLADAGLKLQNFSVNVSGGGPDGFAQHQELARHAGSRRIAYRIGESGDAENDVLAATPTFGPPLAAIRSLHLLNYLA